MPSDAASGKGVPLRALMAPPRGNFAGETPALREALRGFVACVKAKERLYLVLFNEKDTNMRYSLQVKPISYLKANAAEVLARLGEQGAPLLITQNGEAKAVLQDIVSFEETQETMALLKILALGSQDVAAGRVKPAVEVAARLRAKAAA
jgi:prevent-host-death family protein